MYTIWIENLISVVTCIKINIVMPVVFISFIGIGNAIMSIKPYPYYNHRIKWTLRHLMMLKPSYNNHIINFILKVVAQMYIYWLMNTFKWCIKGKKHVCAPNIYQIFLDHTYVCQHFDGLCWMLRVYRLYNNLAVFARISGSTSVSTCSSNRISLIVREEINEPGLLYGCCELGS